MNRSTVQIAQLPFPLATEMPDNAQHTHEQCRPKPKRYADRTWMPPRGTRRSMGKR